MTSNSRFLFSAPDYLNRFFVGWEAPNRELLNTLLVALMTQDITRGIKDESVRLATDDLVNQILTAAFDLRPDLGNYATQFATDHAGEKPSLDDLNDVDSLEEDFNAVLTDDALEAAYKKVVRILTTTTRMPTLPGHGNHFHYYGAALSALQSLMSVPGIAPFAAALQVVYDAVLQLAAADSNSRRH